MSSYYSAAVAYANKIEKERYAMALKSSTAAARVQARIDKAQRELDEAREMLRDLDKPSYPEPPTQKMLRFSIIISGKVYEFAAIRALNGLWYTTGKRLQAHGVDWHELVDFIRKHDEGRGDVIVRTYDITQHSGLVVGV